MTSPMAAMGAAVDPKAATTGRVSRALFVMTVYFVMVGLRSSPT